MTQEYFEKLRDVVLRQSPPNIEEATRLIDILETGEKINGRVVQSLLETRDTKIADLKAKLYPTHEEEVDE